MNFLLSLIFPLTVCASTQTEDAKRSIRALIQPLMAGSAKTRPKGIENFRVDGCEKFKINWLNLLLLKEKATLHYKFKEGCDIQGVVEPKILRPFPANMDLRNIESYARIETVNKITANLETKPILNLEMRNGILTGKVHKVKFEADYQVRINPINNKTVSENLGGELRISEIDGKAVNIKEKILIE